MWFPPPPPEVVTCRQILNHTFFFFFLESLFKARNSRFSNLSTLIWVTQGHTPYFQTSEHGGLLWLGNYQRRDRMGNKNVDSWWVKAALECWSFWSRLGWGQESLFCDSQGRWWKVRRTAGRASEPAASPAQACAFGSLGACRDDWANIFLCFEREVGWG